MRMLEIALRKYGSLKKILEVSEYFKGTPEDFVAFHVVSGGSGTFLGCYKVHRVIQERYRGFHADLGTFQGFQ